MSEEIKTEEMDMELDLDKLEQVSGGASKTKELVTRIVADGHADELKTILKTEGKQLHARNAVNAIRSFVHLQMLPSRCSNRPGRPQSNDYLE